MVIPVFPFLIDKFGASGSPLGILSSATITTTMDYIGDSTSEKQRGGGTGRVRLVPD
jgi:hypothetical protein